MEYLPSWEVTLSYKMAEDWQSMDKKLYEAAGRTSDNSGAGGGYRDHTWIVEKFKDAKRLKKKLEKLVPEVFIDEY